MSNIIEHIEKYLSDNLDNSISNYSQIPDVYDIPNIDQAIERFRKALSRSEKIFFVHDSDADGVGSAAVSKMFLDKIGVSDNNRVHRITKRKEGYGFIPLHVDEAIEQKASLIITTDNGITSKEATDYAHKHNIDVIITDHHQYNKRLYPDKAIVVDPQMIIGDHIFKEVSGTVVFWLFIKAYMKKTLVHIDETDFLEELALTTITDVMPLHHMNRFLVIEGLKHFNKPRKPFTHIIKERAQYTDVITAETLAFTTGPLINAANRFQIPKASFSFLTSASTQEASQWFDYLTTLNEQRKHLTQKYIEMISNHTVKYDKFVYINLSNVEEGLLGILAGKLAEKHGLPAIVTSTQECGEIVKGSGRSISQLDMLSILQSTDIFINAAGHKQAFGVTFYKHKIPNLITVINDHLNKLPSDTFKEPDESFIDIMFKDITSDLYHMIDKFEPFGAGYPKPLFGADVTIVSSNLFGKLKNHTKFILKDSNGDTTEMVLFFETRPFKKGDELRINFTIEWNSWSGQAVGRIKKII